MKKDIRILVVDDHPVVREGLRRMLGQAEDMEVVGEGANGQDALSQIEMLLPNLVLTNIKMPEMDGIELTRQLTERYAACNVIVLSGDDEYLAPAMEAGARGYLLKDIKVEELTRAIRRVHRGEVVISQSIAPKTRIEYEQRYGKGEEIMVEEVQMIIPPPIEANQLMRFASQVEEIFGSSLLQIVGSWHQGTAITVCLIKPTLLGDILNKLAEIPEIETIVEQPPTETLLSLLKKATSMPRLTVRRRRTIFISLKAKDKPL